MTKNTKERLARLRLVRTPSIGPATYHTLIGRYGSALKAIEAVGELSLRGGRSRPLKPASLSAIQEEWDKTHALKGTFIFSDEPDFPRLLAATEPTPPLIIVRGHAHLLHEKAIAIVGARNASANGRKLAALLARDLGEAGYTIVSGMARGIDTAAHKGALSSGTCAVLAGGVDSIYPPENDGLYQDICAQGCIISEMPIGHVGRAKDFPRRNRLISGLSVGVVIVEAALRSGSLITARFALEQSREVFAVPGSPLDPRCRGANSLIKQGAALVESAEDILEILLTFDAAHRLTEKDDDRLGPVSPPLCDLSETDISDFRETIISLLSPTGTDIDDIVRESGATPGLVQVVLLELDLAGRLERLPGNRVCLRTDFD